jgi:hypothetical protein
MNVVDGGGADVGAVVLGIIDAVDRVGGNRYGVTMILANCVFPSVTCLTML